MPRFREWVESRTGLVAGFRAFMLEEVPASVGWRNTLGSVAGAILLAQVLTGTLIALYYVPHPEAAYESLEWMAKHVTLGDFVRALHYWGASFALVATFVHMCRVVISGAYRSPREMTWITGLALSGIIIVLAYTGQLLPFDQAGYWAGEVGIEIASSAPVVGPAIRALMLGGDTVGALTLTRFYALHIVVLPALLGGLVVAHLYLLRKHGPMRAASDVSGRTAAFYPAQFFRDMVAITLALGGLAFVAGQFGGPHGGPLNLADTTYQPRPEWYFLAHFELLRWTRGAFQKMLVAFALPTILVLFLALIPWLDRGPSGAIRDRLRLLSVSTILLVVYISLTGYGISRMPAEASPPLAATAPAPASQDASAAAVELGQRVFREQKCFNCHMVNGVGKDIGPDLSIAGRRLQEPFMRVWMKNPKAFKPDTIMPPVVVSGEQFEGLVAYLRSLQNRAVPVPK